MQTNADNRRRTVTTTVGILVLLAALTAIFLAGVGWLAIALTDAAHQAPGAPPRSIAINSALLNTLPGVALLFCGASILRRSRWSLPFALLSLVLSVASSWHQITVMLPAQAIAMSTPSAKMAFWTGVYAYNFVCLVFYLFLIGFLMTRRTKEELNAPKS